MSPEVEQQIKNVLTNSSMFSDSQISMAIVVLDPVITDIEKDRDEWVDLSNSLRKTREKLEQTIEELQNAPLESNVVPITPDQVASAPVTPYMTVVPGRSPKQKVHGSLGLAHQAISYRIHGNSGSYWEMELYEFKGNQWVLLEKFPKGTKKSDLSWNKKR